MEGKVLVDGVIIDKPGKEILNTAELRLKEPLKYVSRGGLKLSAAIDKFDIDPTGLTVSGCGGVNGRIHRLPSAKRRKKNRGG